MGRSKFCVVIPAFNEEATIGTVVLQTLKYCQPIVIDDCSLDGTSNIASKNGAIVVSHRMNQGYESALNTGFETAKDMGFGIVITLDADGQHDPTLIDLFIEAILEGNDMVLGVRHKFFRISEYIFSYYSNFKFGIKDPCCGMKAYKIKLYRDMGFFDKHKSVGTELAFFSVQNNCIFTQIEIPINSREGDSRYGSILSGNYKILKAIYSSIRRFK